MEQKLKDLIENSQSILITSHISPDGDSVSSSLLLYQILKLNYPQKSLTVSMEEKPYGLDFLSGYSEIEFNPLAEVLERIKPDLLVILDANALHRVSRAPEAVQQYLNAYKPKVAVIDHHENLTIEDLDVSINNFSPAVTLDIYDIFIEKLGLNKPEGYAQTALTGIYTDTGGFTHGNMNFARTFEVVPKLMSEGANLEMIVSQLNRMSETGLRILSELLANIAYSGDFTYSFVSDETVDKEDHEALTQATEAFRTQYLRNVEGRPWGFIVYRDVMAPELTYSVSFRALSGAKDVSEIARRLGGGGHKPAAGVKFPASNVKEALDKVLEVVAQPEAS